MTSYTFFFCEQFCWIISLKFWRVTIFAGGYNGMVLCLRWPSDAKTMDWWAIIALKTPKLSDWLLVQMLQKIFMSYDSWWCVIRPSPHQIFKSGKVILFKKAIRNIEVFNSQKADCWSIINRYNANTTAAMCITMPSIICKQRSAYRFLLYMRIPRFTDSLLPSWYLVRRFSGNCECWLSTISAGCWGWRHVFLSRNSVKIHCCIHCPSTLSGTRRQAAWGWRSQGYSLFMRRFSTVSIIEGFLSSKKGAGFDATTTTTAHGTRAYYVLFVTSCTPFFVLFLCRWWWWYATRLCSNESCSALIGFVH